MKTLLTVFCLCIFADAISQDIIQTIGTGGVLRIRDTSHDFLTISQSSGQLYLLNTLRIDSTSSSSIGVIFKGTNRFLHNFGSNNTFLGVNSGNFTLTGSIGYNTAVGINTLSLNTAGSQNTAIGNESLNANTSGNENTAIGSFTLRSNTTGKFNCALGSECMNFNTTGDKNTALGFQSLEHNLTGNSNTSVGANSLHENLSGSENTAIGNHSLQVSTTGSNNTCLGDSSGYNISTGNNLTLLGNNAQPTSGSANNEITLGNSSITSLRCAVTSITSLSDERDKKNISDLPLGLDFIMKIKPRIFNWDKREWYENNFSDGSKIKDTPTAGFIAQELDEVQTTENAQWLNLVMKENPEKLEATYGNLLPVMVKAIQELKVECEMLKFESAQLKNENIELSQNNIKLSSEVESLKLMNEKISKIEKMMNEVILVEQTTNNIEEVSLTNSK